MLKKAWQIALDNSNEASDAYKKGHDAKAPFPPYKKETWHKLITN
jgi:hypothetical protein